MCSALLCGGEEGLALSVVLYGRDVGFIGRAGAASREGGKHVADVAIERCVDPWLGLF